MRSWRGGNPVINAIHAIADQTDFPFRLIDVGGTHKNDGVKKDGAVGLDVIRSDDGFSRGGFDPADKMFDERQYSISEPLAAVFAEIGGRKRFL